MRKRLITTLALGAALAVVVTGISTAAKPVTLRAGNLILKVNGGTIPNKLPRRRQVPIAVWVEGRISTANGKHPPNIRRTVIDFDRNGSVHARGLPVCRRGQIEFTRTKDARRRCGKAIVGGGKGVVSVKFPDQDSILVDAPITVFNGGVKGRTTTMYIHSFVTEPVVISLVTVVKITKIRAGRYGIRTVATIPRLAGGAGSVLRFRFAVRRLFKFRGQRRSFITARCPDGRFFVDVKQSLFVNEAEEESPPDSGNVVPIAGFEPVTNLKGLVLRPCVPRGR